MRFFLYYILLIFSLQAEGFIHDFNEYTKDVTVVFKNIKSVRQGQNLSVYRGDREVGKIKILMIFHTKLKAKLISKDPIKYKDLVVSNAAELKSLKENPEKAINYTEIGSSGHSYIIKFSCPNLPKEEEQERKIDFSDELLVREQGKNYYSPIPTSTISKLTFGWKLTELTAKQVVLKTGKPVSCAEIINSGIYKKLKPSSDYALKVKSCDVSLLQKKDPIKENPEGFILNLKVDDIEKTLGKNKSYILKMYSGGMLVDSVILSQELLTGDSLDKTFSLSPQDISPGKNDLTFTINEAEKLDGEYFSAGKTIQIGSKEITFEPGSYSHRFTIKTVDSKLVLD